MRSASLASVLSHSHYSVGHNKRCTKFACLAQVRTVLAFVKMAQHVVKDGELGDGLTFTATSTAALVPVHRCVQSSSTSTMIAA
jgi:hypothetical protein